MLLTRLALRNPVAVALFYLFVFSAGAIAFFQMGRSILPPVAIPIVTVSAPYPGADPSEVERLIIEPIEDQLSTVPDVERVSASAQDAFAEIVVRFRFGSNLYANRSAVQQAVDAARATMPADLVPPVVSKDDPTQAPVLEESIGSAILSPGELDDLLTHTILPALRSTSGVGAILVSGARSRQFTVRPQSAPLDALGLTALDVFHSVTGGNDVFPGGVLRTRTQEPTIAIDAAALSTSALENLPLATRGNPGLRIRDVARVEDGYAEQQIVSRVDGDLSIVLSITHADGADSIRTIDAVRTTFAVLARRFPQVRFGELRSDVPYTNAAVAGVLQTLGEGVILTTIVLLLFLHAWRNAIIAAIAIPASLCAAFAAMWALGFSINVLSLMGLSLMIGILVDDSIVIIEAIARNAPRNRAPDEAALAGRQELGGAAFAITLVDVAVFMPIAVMGGLTGEFMREFGAVVVFATAFSLLVSFTLTPLLSARWALMNRDNGYDGWRFRMVLLALQSRKHLFPWTFRTQPVLATIAGWHASINAWNRFEASVCERYTTVWLPVAIRRRHLILVSVASLCLLSLLPLFMGGIPAEFSPPVNRGEVIVDATLPAGTPLAQTDAAASRLSDALLDDGRVKHVVVSAGRAFNGASDVFAANVAELRIVLSDPSAGGDDVVERVKSLEFLTPNAEITGAGKGMGGAAPISYTIAGDATALGLASERIAEALRTNPSATDVRTSDAGLRPRIEIHIDPGKARLLDVSGRRRCADGSASYRRKHCNENASAFRFGGRRRSVECRRVWRSRRRPSRNGEKR